MLDAVERLEVHLKTVMAHEIGIKSIPVWVAVEAWDFGDLSEFFELLIASIRI